VTGGAFLVLLGTAFAWYAARSYRRGYIRTRNQSFKFGAPVRYAHRATHPMEFWFYVATFAGLAVYIYGLAAWVTWRD
jgi:hypothetical protein